MISRLAIKNIGLIDKLTIEFRDHLNIFTGETGAGKSILIDAFRFVLGERLSSHQVRNPDLPGIVEAVFNVPENLLSGYEAFEEYFTDESDLIITRSFFPDGRSKTKINGFSVTLGQLKDLGNRLVDFHGPHDHQLLFSKDSHIEILDRLSAVKAAKKTYSDQYKEYAGLLKKRQTLQEMAASRDRELDTLSYQLKELSRVPLDETEYKKLLNEQQKLNNAEKIHESISALVALFENSEAGITEVISRAFGPMGTLNRVDESTSELTEQLETLQENSSELLSSLINYRDNLSFAPETAQDINSRCDIYYDVLRKYGPSLEDVRNFYAKVKKRHTLMVDLEHGTTDLNKKIAAAKKEIEKTAVQITNSRKKTALSLKRTIEKELSELGMKYVRFECRVEKTELNPEGADSVSFYISPNAGEDLKPLANIVSSGEAARMMLALKKALIKVDPIPVLIFDEIDAQIGGRLGKITGSKLKDLSRERQVILITHLPQIASFADAHFKVSKNINSGRTTTIVEPIDGEMKIKELAKMMSGETESRISLDHARDMLAEAEKK